MSAATDAPTRAAAPQLHVPEEPTERRAAWLARVAAGEAIAEVVDGSDGVADWLWGRWSALAGSGCDRACFGTIVAGYRRELWLWLAGERTWTQACSGLAGRVSRRIGS